MIVYVYIFMIYLEIGKEGFKIEYQIFLGLGDTKNFHCNNYTKMQCDYCGNIAMEFHNKRIWHHPTCVPLVNSLQASSDT